MDNKKRKVSIFLKYTWVIYVILFLTAFLGISLILMEKNSATTTLSSIGSFLGAIFTILALVVAIKEYKSIQSQRGAKEFRAFINDIVVKSRDQMKVDFKLLADIYSKFDTYSEDRKVELFQLLEEAYGEYVEIQYEINKFSGDFSYFNDELHKIVDPLLAELSAIIDGLRKAISYLAKKLSPDWPRRRVPMPKLIKEFEDEISYFELSLMKRMISVTGSLTKIKANSL